MIIPLYRPSIKRRELDAVLSCLIEDQISPSDVVKKLCRDMADFFGVHRVLALREFPRAIELVLAAVTDLRDKRAKAQTGGQKVSVLLDTMYKNVIENSDQSSELELVDFSGNIANADPQVIWEHNLLPDAQISAEFANQAQVLDLNLGWAIDELGQPQLREADFYLLRAESSDIITVAGGTFVMARSRAAAQALEVYSQEFPDDLYISDMNAALGASILQDFLSSSLRRAEIARGLSAAILQGSHRTLAIAHEHGLVLKALGLDVANGAPEVEKYLRGRQVQSGRFFADSIIASFALSVDDETNYKAHSFPKAVGLFNRTLSLPVYDSLTSKEIDVLQRVLPALP